MRGLLALAIVAVAWPCPAAYDGLDELNAQRATRGEQAFIRDAGLTAAACNIVDYRASHGIGLHTSNDFSFAQGTGATGSGTGYSYGGGGWSTCYMDSGYPLAGAAYAYDASGKRYMHLYVKSMGGMVGRTMAATGTVVNHLRPRRLFHRRGS